LGQGWVIRGDYLEEFLKPLAVSQYHLAKEIGVLARRINEIVHGQRRISADTALRLARFFGTSERFWIILQARYDLEAEMDRLGGTLDRIRHSASPASGSPGHGLPRRWLAGELVTHHCSPCRSDRGTGRGPAPVAFPAFSAS
jgi:antitoxin HigA-1